MELDLSSYHSSDPSTCAEIIQLTQCWGHSKLRPLSRGALPWLLSGVTSPGAGGRVNEMTMSAICGSSPQSATPHMSVKLMISAPHGSAGRIERPVFVADYSFQGSNCFLSKVYTRGMGGVFIRCPVDGILTKL